MGRDRLRRTRLAATAGAGVLALAACGGTADAGLRLAAGSAPAPAAGVTAAPSAAPTGSPGTGASASPAASASPSPAIGASEGTLRVLTLQGRVEYGGTSAKVDWVTPFERETGCRVVALDRVRTGEEMAARLGRGSYDVVSPTPELAGELMAAGRVAPVDTALVEPYGDIPEWLRELPALRWKDQVYGVPYLWGVNQVVHGGGRHDGPEDLYTEGPAAIRNDPLGIADAALALARTGSGAGVSDPFRLTPAQLDAAVGLLAERDGAERIYWDDPVEVVRALASGRVGLAQAWPYHADLFARAGRPAGTFGDAPRTGWADSWMVTADAASPNCAYRWLNWITSAEAQRWAAAWTGLAPANPEACTGRARHVCAVYGARDGERPDKVFFAVRPSRDCGGPGGECTDYTDWVARWKDLVK
ncbi:ABC transporter substrate-binding protein [Planomonospora alba]|uniref:ABC transporter substrate-binding protein n=1 Tax=Planomonospora alba TaxID=161354 RepID=A0ABP6P4H2_9ACTN